MEEKVIQRKIAENIKKKRIMMKKSITVAAKDLGISRSQLYRIESGDVLVGVQTLVKLSEYYDISLDEMFSYNNKSKTIGGKIDNMLAKKNDKTKELVYLISELIVEYCK